MDPQAAVVTLTQPTVPVVAIPNDLVSQEDSLLSVSLSDSSRVKVSSSKESVTDRKRKKKKIATDQEHTVTFTVSIALAVPTEEDESNQDIKDMLKKKKRVFEAPRAQNYYHVEYCLLPDEEVTKMDVVTYGMAAKIYMERHDPRVIKTWQSGEVTWIAWSNTHTVTVTKDVLLSMYSHQLEVRIWDTKDKVSARARFDRPKAFRMPQAKPGEDAEDIGGVKANVSRHFDSFVDLQPKKGEQVRPLPTQSYSKRGGDWTRESSSQEESIPDHDPYSPRGQEKSPEQPSTLVAVPNKDGVTGSDVRTFSRLGKLAGVEAQGRRGSVSKGSKRSRTPSIGNTKSGKNSKTVKSPPSTTAKSGTTALSTTQHEDTPVKSKKSDPATQALAEQIKKNGICMVPMKMTLFFAGKKSVTSRLEEMVTGIEDIFITMAIDGLLMTSWQTQQLNPMVIKILSATNLPESPMSYAELREKCQPVYCNYTFCKQPPHYTSKKQHTRNIYWNDISVVLIGTLNRAELLEFLNGPPMEVEVHDRDRKDEEVKLKPTLFGDDLSDKKISSVATVTSRRTLYNPFQMRNKAWDPSGVVKVDLSELLLGLRYLYLKIPIQSAVIPDVLGSETRHGGRIIGIAGAVDGPIDRPLSAGHYMKTCASLKMKIELAHPLTTPDQLAAKEPLLSSQECPYARIVFMFDYKNVEILHKLQNLLVGINARALNLDDLPAHVINAALSTYKLSIGQQTDPELDIVTGFQVLDKEMHIFVLEGMRDKAITTLWETLPQPPDSDLRVLFNSDMSFASRMYGPLDVDLCRVKLHEPLAVIIQQSLLYVRDMVPKPCYQALIKLAELKKVSTLRQAIRNQLFPSTEMIISLSKEFGVPFTSEDFEELKLNGSSDKLITITEDPLSSHLLAVEPPKPRPWTPIDHFNADFVDHIAERDAAPLLDHIKRNKDDVVEQSLRNKLDREKTVIPTVQVDVEVPHNYSSQALNTNEMAIEKSRKMLAEDPDQRYTYSQDYLHSMTFVPVDVDEMRRSQQQLSKSLWKTHSGFVYPGKKTMQESNLHPKRPDQARVADLKVPWHENMMHTNILKPPLSRDNFPWIYRKNDFDLFRQHNAMFSDDPITIHLAGEKLKMEQTNVKMRNDKIWRSKVVVDNLRPLTHRVLPATEMTIAGLSSGNKIDQLKGLLKDPPLKYCMNYGRYSLAAIPALSVMFNARDNVGDNKGFHPGPLTRSSWNMEKNKIPVIDYQHQSLVNLHKEDFNLFTTNRTKMWNPRIQPLLDPDRNNHLFRIHDDPEIWGPVDNTGFDNDPALGLIDADIKPTQDMMQKLEIVS